MTSSTRRFCWRPAAVSLLATGRVSPKPATVPMRSAGMPAEPTYVATLCARPYESDSLYCGVPTESVWPSMSMR